ncbi:unnamed protein product [Adineta ricciae]|uniref:UDP-glucose 6-dehydrogenase n=1 Tax=Adineta ricciae TaxID=249248 RepID=A0A815LDF3_ADIRI|nr:unnamed protein product [Adineta ricciae]
MKTIAVIGLGYVGLPLSIEFGKYRPTIGFDVNKDRINELKLGHDSTNEFSSENLKCVEFLQYSYSLDDLRSAQIFIVAVPTPVNAQRQPDLSNLLKSSEMIGKILKQDDIVIYESTVYPGVTEDECVPILERISGLKYNENFFCGYSPERINPGDQNHQLSNVCKIISGSTPAISQEINELYQEIIPAGTYVAPSVRVAEAAKMLENVQRDVNIALMNEITRIFRLMNLDTHEVLKAARTKWNFIPYEPGLVGGHCIGIDSYYLIHKACQLNYYPEIVSSARRMNDSMGCFIVEQVIKLMIRKNIQINGAKILILGITFKENCHDIRNSKVIDIINKLIEFGCLVDVVDPWADSEKVYNEYKITLKSTNEFQMINKKIIIENYDTVIIAVAHQEFSLYDFSSMSTANKVLYDVKGILPKDIVDGRL